MTGSAAAEALASLAVPITTCGLGLMRRRSTVALQQHAPAVVEMYHGVDGDTAAAADRLQYLAPSGQGKQQLHQQVERHGREVEEEELGRQRQGRQKQQRERQRRLQEMRQGHRQQLMSRFSSPEALGSPGSPAIIVCAASTDAPSGTAGTVGSEGDGCMLRHAISDSLALST